MISLSFSASITPVMRIASVAAIGHVASSRVMYLRCVLPFAQVLALALPSLSSWP